MAGSLSSDLRKRVISAFESGLSPQQQRLVCDRGIDGRRLLLRLQTKRQCLSALKKSLDAP